MCVCVVWGGGGGGGEGEDQWRRNDFESGWASFKNVEGGGGDFNTFFFSEFPIYFVYNLHYR